MTTGWGPGKLLYPHRASGDRTYGYTFGEGLIANQLTLEGILEPETATDQIVFGDLRIYACKIESELRLFGPRIP